MRCGVISAKVGLKQGVSDDTRIGGLSAICLLLLLVGKSLGLVKGFFARIEGSLKERDEGLKAENC